MTEIITLINTNLISFLRLSHLNPHKIIVFNKHFAIYLKQLQEVLIIIPI